MHVSKIYWKVKGDLKDGNPEHTMVGEVKVLLAFVKPRKVDLVFLWVFLQPKVDDELQRVLGNFWKSMGSVGGDKRWLSGLSKRNKGVHGKEKVHERVKRGNEI
ncbi:hypothetical protein DVH24_025348 [Malus domestica]|uniref:Uncharacterized protein n=1 Tax=Malus domestica TaxID=3750 RepID=A0A498HQY2_MALDO|nr:hypothetical protein DVH24_025348 [Malus domestica]